MYQGGQRKGTVKGTVNINKCRGDLAWFAEYCVGDFAAWPADASAHSWQVQTMLRRGADGGLRRGQRRFLGCPTDGPCTVRDRSVIGTLLHGYFGAWLLPSQSHHNVRENRLF